MKKNIFVLSLLLLVTVSGWCEVTYRPYNLRIKQNSGHPIPNLSPSWMVDGGTAVALGASANPTGKSDDWYFIPVGGSEPGWYYIQNRGTGKYMTSTGAGNLTLVDISTPSGDAMKWRLVKTQAYDVNSSPGTNPTNNPGVARHFRLVSKNNVVILKNGGNASTVIPGNSIAAGTYATVEILMASSNKNYEQATVYNQDMELVSNYWAISNTETNYPVMPAYTTNIDFSLNAVPANHIKEQDYFPVGYSRTIADLFNVRLCYSASSSGTDKGYYFVRIKNGGKLYAGIRTTGVPNTTSTYEVKYRTRVSTSDGQAPVYLPYVFKQDGTTPSSATAVGQLTALSVQNNIAPTQLIPYSSPPTPITVSSYATTGSEDPVKWNDVSFSYQNSDGLTQSVFCTFDNLFKNTIDSDVYMDIDNFIVSLTENWSSNYDYRNYTLRFKQNGGAPITAGNNYIRSYGKYGIEMGAANDLQGMTDAWNFVSVGADEPGWYYIRNAQQGTYLKEMTSLEINLDLGELPSSPELKNKYKWRIIKTKAYDASLTPGSDPTNNPGVARHFKIVSYSGNILHKQGTGGLRISAPATVNSNSLSNMVEIMTKVTSNIKEISTIYNEDMELVSNYTPLAIDVTTFPALPKTTEGDFSEVQVGGVATEYFPIGFDRSSKANVRLIHNYKSSNSPGIQLSYGFYFLRVLNQGRIFAGARTPTAPGANAIFEVSYWGRTTYKNEAEATDLKNKRQLANGTVAADGTTGATYAVGQITSKDVPTGSSIPQIPPIPPAVNSSGYTYSVAPVPYNPTFWADLSSPDETKNIKDDPWQWEFQKFSYKSSTASAQNKFITVDNLFSPAVNPGDTVFMDIDNLKITLVESWQRAYPFHNYNIRMKANTGALTGNASWLNANGNALSLVASTTNGVGTDDWQFVPVGGDEPGWYYIRSANNTASYLRDNGSANAATLANLIVGNDAFKWRLFKTTAYQAASTQPAAQIDPTSNPAAARHFRLISKLNNALYATNGGNGVNTSNSTNRSRSTVEIQMNAVAATTTITTIFNEDMELVSNYWPVNNITNNPFEGLPSLPVPEYGLEEDFSPSVKNQTTGVWEHTDATDYFPVGYARSGTEDARLYHDYYSSGNADEFGFYFVRLNNGGRLYTYSRTATAPAANSLYQVTYWSRSSTYTGLEPDPIPYLQTQTKGTSEIGAIGQLTATNIGTGVPPLTSLTPNSWTAYSSPPTRIPQTLFNPLEQQNNPDRWEFMGFNFVNGGTLQQSVFITVDNLVKDGKDINQWDQVQYLDIDNLNITMLGAENGRAFNYKENNTPQQVHESTQVIYTKMNESNELQAMTTGYNYYRWHVDELDFNGLSFANTTGLNRSFRGLFKYGGDAAGARKITFIPSEVLQHQYSEGQRITITCDASNYTDYTTTSTQFTEPTLSFRNHFEMRPAWESAQNINNALANNGVLEYVELEAPIGAANNGTRLRLTPQYYIDNYYIATAGNEKDEANLNRATRFYWVRYRDGSQYPLNNESWKNALPANVGTGANRTVLRIADGGTAPFTYATSDAAGSSYKYLQIDNSNRTATNYSIQAGQTEYFDCYVRAGSTGDYKRIARFKVTYVDKSLAGPLPENRGGYTPDADLWSVRTNKKMIAQLTFDQTENRYNMGVKPLGLKETSYGFTDPTKFATGETANGTHDHHRAPYWSEYGFPRMIGNGSNTAADNTNGGGTNSYGWSAFNTTTPGIMDRTFIQTGKTGNMLYVDAADLPGTFAALDINEALCPGTELYFSAWIVNLNNGSETSADNVQSTASRPNLVFLLKDKATDTPIKYFYTGDIGYLGTSTSDPLRSRWNQVAFSFKVPEYYVNQQANLTLEIRNNGLTTTGNDFAIDEVCIYRSNPGVEAKRTVQTFCKPDGNIENASPLEMLVDVDLSQLALTGSEGKTTKLYFRFLDDMGVTFPDKKNGEVYPDNEFNASDTENHIYLNEGLYQDDTNVENRYAYGTIILNGQNNIQGTDTIVAFDKLIGFDKANTAITGHVYFKQSIPANLVNSHGQGIFRVYVAESGAALLSPKCAGEASFEVRYDSAHFKVMIEGTTEAINLEDLLVCTNSTVNISAQTFDPINPGRKLYTVYDWYYGPIDTKDTEAVEYNDDADFDPTLNFVGLNEMEVNEYFIREDLKNFRSKYPEGGLPVTIPQQEDADLLARIGYYVDNGLVVLYQPGLPLYLSSMAPYYITAIPIEQAYEMKSDGSGPDLSKPLRICTSPAEVRIQATSWGSVLKYGEVTDNGLPVKNYPDFESNLDYEYTVRLPEKIDNVNVNDVFVVPFLYFDEVSKAAVDLVRVDGNYVNAVDNAEGIKLAGVHIGVIDKNKPNQLDSLHTVKNTRRPEVKVDDNNNVISIEIVEIEPVDKRTYWDLDFEKAKMLFFKSYPLIWNSYNYYHATPAHPLNPDYEHTLEDEGNPYPIGTLLGGVPLDNNKIALEVKASSVLSLNDNVQLNPNLKNKLTTTDGKFKPGSIYEFRLRVTADEDFANGGIVECDKEFFFKLKVVPNTVYWAGTGALNSDSWHDDKNWKSTPDGTGSAFAPLRPTSVVLLNGMDKYPMLKAIEYYENDAPPSAVDEIMHTVKLTVTIDENGKATPIPGAPETKYIEFDKNWEPNTVSEIYFQKGSELGRPDLLTYDGAKVDLEVNTAQWYGLSAPLRDMYSGDYMFPYANPLTEMRLYNTSSPQSGATYTEWTLPFNKTIEPLTPGMGYSAKVGALYYNEVSDAGAVAASRDSRDKAQWMFPQTKMTFNFYHELTKKLQPKTETILPGGRDYGSRFAYEETMTDEYLVELPTGRTTKGEEVVVGNPLMSHIDFEKFYDVNKDVIIQSFKILTNGDDFPTYSETDDVVATGGLTAKSIPPMQTFIVTTKDGYSGVGKLKITKEMSVTYPTSKLRSFEQVSNILRITTHKDTYSSEAVVAFSNQSDNGYVLGEDTRRMLVSDLQVSPSVFTIADGMYLDINRMKEVAGSIPIGIMTSNKGFTQLRITGFNSISGSYDWFFKDTEKSSMVPVGDSDSFEYSFDNTEGDLIGRFYLIAQQNTSIDVISKEKISVYIQNHVIHALSSDGSEITELMLYRPDGQQVYHAKDTGKSHCEIPVSDVHQVLIVKAKTMNASSITKVSNQ